MCHTTQVARSMGVPLVPRRARVFDEINDIVGCDLVLAMDSFDATEVRQQQHHSVMIIPTLGTSRQSQVLSYEAMPNWLDPTWLRCNVPDWLHEQVLREVAVMDAINRGGSYSMRIRMLAPFADARKCEYLASSCQNGSEGCCLCGASTSKQACLCKYHKASAS